MFTQYIESEDTIRFTGPAKSINRLNPGIYQITTGSFGEIFLNKKQIKTDNLINLDGSINQKIHQSVNTFLSKEIKEAFVRYDMLYKRGILLYGPPGTGKTSIINILMRTAVNKDMVVLLSPAPYLISQVVSNIREIEKDSRPIMVVWEELERWLDDSEEEVLDLIDGVHQLEDIFYVATTNYIDNIPLRIRNRPSRFAEVIEVGPLEKEMRRQFILAKVHKEDNIDIDKWIDETEGMTVDHIKDLIISVLVLKVPFNEAIDKLRNLGCEESVRTANCDDEEDDECYYNDSALKALRS